MNQLLRTIDITTENQDAVEVLNSINAKIHMIGIETDLFFVPEQNRQTLELLQLKFSEIYYHEISSIHGHDAFLIEYEQLNKIIEPLFQTQAAPILG